jgi:hypothetical protein
MTSVSKSDFDNLVENSIFAADNAAINIPAGTREIDKTKIIAEATLRFAVCNGLVKMVDPSDWPWGMPMNPDQYPIKLED